MAVIELDIPYELVGPRGDRAVLNDQSDTDYVGMLREVTGLDSPDVRESAEDLVAADGGVHGDFWYGRRPVTIAGVLLNPASPTERNERQDKLLRACDAMRADATLSWTPSGGVPSFIRVRRQQPPRVSGAWQKEFQLALVAADPRIYSQTLNNMEVNATTSMDEVGRSYDLEYDKDYGPAAPNGQLIVHNAGSATSFPVVTITGPGVNPVISNLTTGQAIRFNYTLIENETLVVDTLNRTVYLNGNPSVSRYAAVDFTNSSWWGLVPGNNDIRISFNTFSGAAKLGVAWRDAWL